LEKISSPSRRTSKIPSSPLISRGFCPTACSIAAASLVASGRKFQRTQYWMLISMVFLRTARSERSHSFRAAAKR